MRWRMTLGLIVAAAGCAKQRPVAPAATGNSGIDIVPPAARLASLSTPTTIPAARAERQDLIQTIEASQSRHHYHLIDLIRAADLLQQLSTTGDYTIFAPTDEAFAKLPPGRLDWLMEPRNHDKLIAFARYHIVKGRLSQADLLQSNGTIQSYAGPNLTVRGIDDKMTVNDANVIEAVGTAGNGNVFWIDNILDPEMAEGP